MYDLGLQAMTHCIFDMDGLLLDTGETIILLFKAFGEHVLLGLESYYDCCCGASESQGAMLKVWYVVAERFYTIVQKKILEQYGKEFSWDLKVPSLFMSLRSPHPLGSKHLP